jgi:hypothetical protein
MSGWISERKMFVQEVWFASLYFKVTVALLCSEKRAATAAVHNKMKNFHKFMYVVEHSLAQRVA